MTTIESKGPIFLLNESIRIDSHNGSNRIDSNRELECSNLQPQSLLLRPMLGETDGRTPDRCIDPALHTMRAVPAIILCLFTRRVSLNCSVSRRRAAELVVVMR